MSDAGPLLLGRYRLERRLGAGGMATVFLARDERLGRRVAVKRLHAESPEATARRLEREARLGASLNHPNVVTVYDVDADEEGAVVVMEYVEGETLAAALRRGPLPPDRAMEIVRGVAAALDHAHAGGVVHRDVKPANVLLGREGAVKLVDLGIAHAVDQSRLTLTGAVLGTASYMAPEQLEGKRVGPPADVYSLAAVAYEALSGLKARDGVTPVEVAHRIVSEPPPDLREAWPEAGEAAAVALERGMSRDPADRPRSAGDLARDLAAGIPARGAAAGAVASDPTEPTAAAATEEVTESAVPTEPAAPPRREWSADQAREATGEAPSEPASGSAASQAPGTPAASEAPSAPLIRHGRSGRRRSLGSVLAVAILAIALGAVVVALLAGVGSDGPAGEADPGASAAEDQADGGTAGAGESESAAASPEGTDDPAEPAPIPLAAPAGEEDPERGAQLNDQGKALIDQGEPAEAVPVLQEAVTSFPEGTTDVNYAFALYNLGNALRLAGRPEEAVPVLERRLEIPNQRSVVRAELRRARAAAAAG